MLLCMNQLSLADDRYPRLVPRLKKTFLGSLGSLEKRGKFGEHSRSCLKCSLNFPRASYLDERTADV